MYTFYSAPTMPNRVTVVGNFDEKRGEFSIAVARCGKKDQFVRKIGRTIASGRLKKGVLYGSYPGDGSSVSFVEIAQAVSSKVREKGLSADVMTAPVKTIPNEFTHSDEKAIITAMNR